MSNLEIYKTYSLKGTNLVAEAKYLSVQSDGPAGEKHWDKMGIFTLSTEKWNGKHLWEQDTGRNKLFYSTGES